MTDGLSGMDGVIGRPGIGSGLPPTCLTHTQLPLTRVWYSLPSGWAASVAWMFFWACCASSEYGTSGLLTSRIHSPLRRTVERSIPLTTWGGPGVPSATSACCALRADALASGVHATAGTLGSTTQLPPE